MENDFELWRRSRCGDAEAFACLFRRHARSIYNYCFRRVGDWAVAEDLVSIVFLEAWRRREQELPPGKVLPWLYGIATNVVRNRRRSEWRYRAALNRLPRTAPSPDFAGDVQSRVDDEREMRRIFVELARLSREEQDVIALCIWAELSYEDAALALDVPLGTVRSRLSRARRRLRELDDGRGHEYGREQSVPEAVDQ